MCLVFSVLFIVLSVNFYLNGFMIQAIISMVVALAAIVFMGRNIKCGINSCKTKTKEENTDDN